MTIPDDQRLTLWSRPGDRGPDDSWTNDRNADEPQPLDARDAGAEDEHPNELELWILKDLLNGCRTYRPETEGHLLQLRKMGLVNLLPKTEETVLAWLTTAGLEYLRQPLFSAFPPGLSLSHCRRRRLIGAKEPNRLFIRYRNVKGK